MKKIVCILFAILIVLSLTACKTIFGMDPGSDGKEKGAASRPDADGMYDVGDFTVFIPDGWTTIPVPDSNDPSKILTNDIQLAKGALYNETSDTWNTEDGVSFYVTYLLPEDFEGVSGARDYYARNFAVTDMEDLTIGDLTWHGFLVRPIGAPVYMMWAERTDGNGGYYTSISTAYGMSLEDADIRAILGSLK